MDIAGEAKASSSGEAPTLWRRPGWIFGWIFGIFGWIFGGILMDFLGSCLGFIDDFIRVLGIRKVVWRVLRIL